MSSLRHRLRVCVGTLGVLLAPTQARAIQYAECVNDEALPAACFPDVLCPQFSSYLDFRRSVVHISGPDIFGTGVLINNAQCKQPNQDDPECGAPYLLTAAHLVTNFIDTEITAGDIYALENETTFTLGFEAVYCGGNQAYNWEIAVGGAQVLGSSAKADLLLLRLSTSLPTEAGPYFVGWGSNSFAEVALIAHPCGDAKKMAIAVPGMIEFQKMAYRDVLRVISWDEGGILGGSSGGPLLADDGALLGVLSTSEVDVCPGSTSNSIFTAISSIVPFLGPVANNFSYYDAYDTNAYAPILDVEMNSKKYGSGEVVSISARQKVFLTDGFFAEEGSNVRVIIVPESP